MSYLASYGHLVSTEVQLLIHLLCLIGEGQGESEGDEVEEELDDEDDDEDCLSFR